MLLKPLDQLDPERFDTASILKKLASSSRKLAELKGIAGTIPNQEILINTLGLQEAKDSSEIENIVTTHDALFKGDAFAHAYSDPATKEVLRYRQALRMGFESVRETGLIANRQILMIQEELEQNNAGFRKLPGTDLQTDTGRVIYTPPQNKDEIIRLMGDLERFINDDALFSVDPLIKMALIHHQFESIHPFYDGNGRTGRIINVLYLVKAGLLDIPLLYLSSYIVQNKGEYYRLLQAVREDDAWEEWVIYMLSAVEQTSEQAIHMIRAISHALMDYKHRIRRQFRFYSQDLINSLFQHPYTKIAFLVRDLKVSRLTATKYLDELTDAGFVEKIKAGKSNYYVNLALIRIIRGDEYVLDDEDYH